MEVIVRFEVNEALRHVLTKVIIDPREPLVPLLISKMDLHCVRVLGEDNLRRAGEIAFFELDLSFTANE
jgi:hypothetical protein